MRKTLDLIFSKSFKTFLENERNNILMGTSERNLCARLACILESTSHEKGLTNYVADVEYNRKQNGRVKTIIDNQMREVQITTDLILHSRGKVIGSDNLIAFEMKRIEHRDEELLKDRTRLMAMTKSSYDGVWSADGETHPEHVCGYKLGYLAILDSANRCFNIEQYSEGVLKNSFRSDF